MKTPSKLLAIKTLHTVVWALLAGCIVVIPIATYFDDLRTAALLIALVLVEVLVLALHRGRCPLTAVAARYTSDRADNFDIFLPVWLARHNKVIFGSLFVGALLYTLVTWVRHRGTA